MNTMKRLILPRKKAYTVAFEVLQGSGARGDANFSHREKFARIFCSLALALLGHHGRSQKIRPTHPTTLQIIMKSFLVVTLGLSIFNIAKGEEEMKTKVISLPKPVLEGRVSIEETIKVRRSVRRYSDKELTLEQLSQLLWAAQGITDMRGLRAAPSPGALYPLEIYVVKKEGLFHYTPQGHKLELISPKDLRQELAGAAWGQGFISQAPVDIVICAVYERVTSRYGERGIRYTDIEVGHAAENIHLQAVALGLDSVPVGAFGDDAVSSLLGLPRKEEPIYIIPVGYKR